MNPQQTFHCLLRAEYLLLAKVSKVRLGPRSPSKFLQGSGPWFCTDVALGVWALPLLHAQ